MNPRIQELAKQARLVFDLNNSHLLDGDLEKFAELIVRECALLVQGVPTDTMGYHTADKKIKQHFGIE
jgi:hypothetical protein